MGSDHHDTDSLPGWAKRFLRFVCPDYLLEEIEGDLVQKYEFDISQYGLRRARRKLITNIIRFLRPGIFMRNKFDSQPTQLGMLRNYILMALRVSRRQSLYAFINIFGLSLGLSVSLLIGIYIADELSYDKFIPGAENIYRIGINETFKGDEILYANSGAPLAEAMRREMPDVEDVTRVIINTNPVRYEDQTFMEQRFMTADSNFLSFFGYELLEGNAKECLKGPDKMVLTMSAARKYFAYDGVKGSSPIGKQLLVGRDAKPMVVTGVMADVPANTHMKFDMIRSMESVSYSKSDCWGCYGAKTYFKTIRNTDTGAIEAKLEEFAQQQIIPSIEKDLNISHDQFVKSGDIVRFFVQPLLSIHLESAIQGEFEPNGDLRYVYIFGAVGIFLIIIACINFMNLSTARAMNRAKEVGVRKTIGATRGLLIPQFMTESFLYVAISGLLALLLAWLAMGPFNNLSGKNLYIDLVGNVDIVGYVLLFLVFVGVLAGAYPAFYLTSFNPVSVLKTGRHKGPSGSFLRSSLVVFQFTISMILIVGTMIIYKQVQFIRSHNIGFDKENMIRIPQSYQLGENYQAFKDEVLRHSDFVNAGFMEQVPPNIQSTSFLKSEHTDQLIGIVMTASDHDLIATMGYVMKEGRFFSKEFLSDSNAVVINETAARMFDFKTIEGKRIGFSDENMYNVIGVVRDFNFASLKSDIKPMAIFLNPEVRANFVARVTAGDPTEKIDLLQTIWKKYADGKPFQFAFVDDDYDLLFRTEQRLGTVFLVFTAMAIVIACLGLFGLITYTAAQRTKEIGIRKVLGASQGQVVFLLLSAIGRLLLISIVISIPLAWYGLNQWLQSFAYRTTFDVYSVLIACVAGVGIVLLTVGYRSLRAASVNPADSLKNE